MTQSLPLHVIEELLRLDDAGRLSKVCKVWVNGRLSQEYRTEPKVQVGGPAVLITYGYDASNLIVSIDRTVTTWTAPCQANVDAALPPSGTGTPIGGIANFHDHQTLSVVDTSWTAIPNVANRSTLVIQNNSNKNLLVNSDNMAPLTEGILIATDEERQYEDVGPEVTLYLVSDGGPAVLIDIEQIGFA